MYLDSSDYELMSDGGEQVGLPSTGWRPTVICDLTYTTYLHLYFGLWYRFLLSKVCVLNILSQNIFNKRKPYAH